jgi:hypothetical protein
LRTLPLLSCSWFYPRGNAGLRSGGTCGSTASSPTLLPSAARPTRCSGEDPNVLPATVTNTNNGTGTWIHITLDEPVSLAANILYGFDLFSVSGDVVLFFETSGIDDSVPGGNPYPDDTAYTSGSAGIADNVLNPEPGDRIFVVELDAL